MEAIKADYFVTPTVEFRYEDHEAGPMSRLIKERKAPGLVPPSKASGTWRWVPAKEETDWSFVHISFPQISIFLYYKPHIAVAVKLD